MAKEYFYEKIVIGAQLHEELKQAGFLVQSVYSKYETQEEYCKIVLEDEELKDPASIVEAHIPKPEEPTPPINLTEEIANLKIRIEKLEGQKV